MNSSTEERVKRKDCYALLVAAGASTRLGQPKQLIEYQQQPLILTVSQQIEAIFYNRFRIVLGAHHELIEPYLKPFSELIIINNQWQKGMASTIRKGIQSLPENAQAVMVLLVDQPLITQQHLSILLERYLQDPDYRITSYYNGVTGVPAIFPKQDFQELQKLTGDKGAKHLLEQENTISVSIPEAALDIDTPQDYKNLINHRVENN